MLPRILHNAPFNLTAHPYMHQIGLFKMNTRFMSLAMYAAAWAAIFGGWQRDVLFYFFFVGILVE